MNMFTDNFFGDDKKDPEIPDLKKDEPDNARRETTVLKDVDFRGFAALDFKDSEIIDPNEKDPEIPELKIYEPDNSNSDLDSSVVLKDSKFD